MTQRGTILLSVLVLIGVLLVAFSFIAVGGEEKPAKSDKNKENIEIGDLAKRYEPAPFSHWKHQDDYGIKCVECHHKYTDDMKKKGEEPAKCTKCHEGKKLEKAYHKQCKSCHRKAKKEGKKAPTKCTACHAKAKKK